MRIPSLTDRAVLELENRSTLNNRVARLVVLVSRVTQPRMQLAIGGAVAGVDAGWRRNTVDLDVFARPTSAKRLVKSLAAVGMRTFWITDAHAVAWLREDNENEIAAGESPSIRIDVLSTLSEPEASAIRTAVKPRALGVPVKVFRPDYLTAIKFLAARPLDLVDFDELILLGVDPERVRYLVATADASRSAAVASRIRKLLKPPSGVAESRSPYLSRHGFHQAFAAAMARSGRTPGRSARNP